MGKFEEDARKLLEYVGGSSNISAVSHCVTRMRFALVNPSKNAGFTDGKQWLQVCDRYHEINVEKDRKDPDGIFHWYQELIRYRHTLPVIPDGTYVSLLMNHPDVFA